MIMLCSLMSGILIYKRKYSEIKSLAAASSLFELMIFELKDRNSGTNEILKKIYDSDYYAFDSEERGFKYASREVNDLVREGIDYLGKSDVKAQVDYIGQKAEKIREIYDSKEKLFKSRKHLYIELSVLLGILICLMMI